MELKNKELIGALVGLARSTEGNEHKITPETNRLILDGLYLVEKASESDAAKMVERLHDEKHRIVPDCATCASPCGRTFDLDIVKLYSEASDVLEVKLELLRGLEELSALFLSTQGQGLQLTSKLDLSTVSAFAYKALVYLGIEGLQSNFLRTLLTEMDELTA